jgi:molecular chaperone GrpE
MNSDPRFHPPGPNGPGAGTDDPETERPQDEQSPADERSGADGAVVDQQPADGEPAADAAALEAKAAKADEYLALAQRTQADFENYRKRAGREAAAATQRGAVKLAKELLPAVDNLERALAHAPEAARDDEDAFVAGVKAVHADLIAALQRAGIEGYSPEGEAFDPTLHEAVVQQPFEGFDPGTVVEVFQRGYRIGESVLRPARVVVAG